MLGKKSYTRKNSITRVLGKNYYTNKTSRNFLVRSFREEMLYAFLFPFFSLPLIFTFVAASISHFLSPPL